MSSTLLIATTHGDDQKERPIKPSLRLSGLLENNTVSSLTGTMLPADITDPHDDLEFSSRRQIRRRVISHPVKSLLQLLTMASSRSINLTLLLIMLLLTDTKLGQTSEATSTSASKTESFVGTAVYSHCLLDLESYLESEGLQMDPINDESNPFGASEEELQLGEWQMAQIGKALRRARNELRLLVDGMDERKKRQMRRKGRDMSGVRRKNHFEQHGPGSMFWRPVITSACKPIVLLSIVETLVGSLYNCDRMSLDWVYVANFLMRIPRTRDRHLIHRLAQRIVAICWRDFESTVVDRLVGILDKAAKSVFRNIEKLARKLAALRKGERQSAEERAESKLEDELEEEWHPDDPRGWMPITLDEAATQNKPDKLLAMTKHLKGIDLRAEENVLQLAQVINGLFEKDPNGGMIKRRLEKHIRLLKEYFTSFFVRRCEHIISWITPYVVLGDIYKRRIPKRLSTILAAEVKTNKRLDYELQLYRVCKSGIGKAEKILELLDSMHRPANLDEQTG